MNAQTAPFELQPTGAVLRGDVWQMRTATEQWSVRRFGIYVLAIFLGAGLYGAAMGWWRAPQQGLFTAIKFPLIILLTAMGNALLNAMLAPLLGLNLPFRQSFMAILMSFMVAAAILGSFSPLVGFLIWNAPAMVDAQRSGGIYTIIMLTHVAVIAFAGIAANLHLLNFLRSLSRDPRVAHRVLLGWLAGNLFLGSQLSWIFRPFIGAPGLPLQFLRDDPLRGNFYETVFKAFLRLFNLY